MPEKPKKQAEIDLYGSEELAIAMMDFDPEIEEPEEAENEELKHLKEIETELGLSGEY